MLFSVIAIPVHGREQCQFNMSCDWVRGSSNKISWSKRYAHLQLFHTYDHLPPVLCADNAAHVTDPNGPPALVGCLGLNIAGAGGHGRVQPRTRRQGHDGRRRDPGGPGDAKPIARDLKTFLVEAGAEGAGR